jgi:secreted trypsin-like serine protease
MKQVKHILVAITILCLFTSLIVRHDVNNDELIVLAKEFPQICHPKFGEATLIHPYFVVSAAHVAKYLKKDLEEGKQHYITNQGKQYRIKAVVLHPNYSQTRTSIDNDIALIQLSTPITNVIPAKIYAQNQETGKHITLVGKGQFGTGLTGPKKEDKITRAATNKIDGVTNSWIYFSFDAPSSKNTTKFEGVSGPGDSGGPAFAKINGELYIIGVSSHQRKNGNKRQGFYGATEYYARVSTYVNWINKTIHQKSSSSKN